MMARAVEARSSPIVHWAFLAATGSAAVAATAAVFTAALLFASGLLVW